MAKPIEATPVLEGKDAIAFFAEMDGKNGANPARETLRKAPDKRS